MTRIPRHLVVIDVTIAELEAAVTAARNVARRALRLRAFYHASRQAPLATDGAVPSHSARLRVALGEPGRVVGGNDLRIAALGSGHGPAIVTQGGDFDALADLELLDLVKV